VYDTGAKLMAKFNQFPGSPAITSDYYLFFDKMPNLDIEILRDRQDLWRLRRQIESLIRNGYSQNYAYLIKKPTDQYQVIVESPTRIASTPKTYRSCTFDLMTACAWFPERGHEVDPVARPAVSHHLNPVHERDVLLQRSSPACRWAKPPTTPQVRRRDAADHHPRRSAGEASIQRQSQPGHPDGAGVLRM